MKTLASLLAEWIVRRRGWLLAGALAVGLAAGGSLAFRQKFDTDILNLLPGGNPAVQGLRIYNKDFTQAREIAFLLTWQQAPADVDHYRSVFADLLRQQPWVVRILDTSPMEGASGSSAVSDILVPLLLNLPEEQFRQTLGNFQPPAIKERIARLAAQMEAGSPRARFELENDPFGVAAVAARPVWETISLSEAFDLVTPDNTAVIVPAITNQEDLSAQACEEMMGKVRAFIAEARQKLGPGGPEIGVTGRTPYVEEIAASMQRDIIMTSSVSLLMVILLFWVGFRRLVPLAGITLILAFTALVATALGVMIFQQLNIIAISFCSILFGLGDDFSLLLCQHFYQSRAEGEDRKKSIASSIRHCLPGMLWVALTTGIGFLTLAFSGSTGFAQLGTLVALGIMLCAIFMPVLLFPFLSDGTASSAARSAGGTVLAERLLAHPRRILLAGLAGFALLTVLALAPWRTLRFDISPSSLEPRHTPAAQTLAEMMKKFPATFEPLMIVIEQPDGPSLSALNRSLEELKRKGLIETSSSPSGLYLDAGRTRQNRQALAHANLPAARIALAESLTTAGLNPLKNGSGLLDKLEHQAKQETASGWSDYLPPTSTWWFLLDRMVSPSTSAVIAYAKTAPALTPQDRRMIEAEITAAVPGARVTGWSQTLSSLIPWAQHELLAFGSAVALIIALILWCVYRDLKLWLWHVLSIAGAMAGTAATLKVLDLQINLLNVLAFPLILGVGVDYGTHLILAARKGTESLAGTVKAVTLSGLTTATGFGALILAQNPSLSGLGAICGTGVLWCLVSSLVLVVPGAILRERPSGGAGR